ncbi:MAG: GTPase Era [Nisaea sp.]|nr:GTPase Era [Nisaea sp.]OUX90959.1 MAG: GTPase Era [Candidatus Endolissoclinum sp. TMED26]
MSERDTRCGLVALLGAPNAGKSTLMNTLVGAKVSIVTPKVQTTRSRIRGVAMVDQAQVVFIDTPGIFVPRRRLDRAMVDAAWGGASDADQVVFLYDGSRRRIDDDSRRIAATLRENKRPAILAINKIDSLKRDQLLPLAAELNELADFQHSFMISAEKGNGCADLMGYLATQMPSGPWLYPEDDLTDLPLRLYAAEVTREQVYLQLHDELPYAITVETEKWQDREDGSVRIDQVAYVQRESQRKIVLGHQGKRIKTIGSRARADLEATLDRRVHLFLFIKVRENWMEDPERYEAWGLDPNV